jgi:hypothetical protein
MLMMVMMMMVESVVIDLGDDGVGIGDPWEAFVVERMRWWKLRRCCCCYCGTDIVLNWASRLWVQTVGLRVMVLSPLSSEMRGVLAGQQKIAYMIELRGCGRPAWDN